MSGLLIGADEPDHHGDLNVELVTGPDNTLGHIIAACDAINHWSACAVRDLSDEYRKTHAFMRPLKKLLMHYRPLGAVGVITPWNGPFGLAVNPTVQALFPWRVASKSGR